MWTIPKQVQDRGFLHNSGERNPQTPFVILTWPWQKKLTVYGHEFVLDGKTVGAVSTINNGKVWIDASLDAHTRTVIAALASGLLLRTDVESADSHASR
jgi:hypothetical protein